MRTLAQIEASRRNGAKSHGPATPEGKATSSQNAMKHGLSAEASAKEGLSAEASAKEDLRARELHLTPQEEEDYLELYDSYTAHYDPESPLEAHLVRKCAITDHLLSRARSIQHTLIDLQAAASQEDLDHAYPDLDAPGLRAAGFQLLNDRSTSFRNIDAHQSRLLRELAHYLERLDKLRRQRPKKEPHPAFEPETSPEPEVSL